MDMPPMFGMDSNYEVFESQLVARYLRAGTHGLDLGAHTGHYTMLMGRYLSSTGRVLAVEPDPTNLVRLLQNVGANGLKNTEVLSAAVGGSPRLAKLYLDGGNGGDNRLRQDPGEDRSSLLVNCVTVDQAADRLEKLEFIKIDVQGAEVEALLSGGAQRTLARCRDLAMLVECSPHDLRMSGTSAKVLIKALAGFGFVVLVCDPRQGKLIPVSGDEPFSDNPAAMVFNLWCVRGHYLSVLR